MTDFSNLLNHPDAEEIVSRLVVGDSPKDISQWLKIKYSDKDQKHLVISAKILQEYADKHLDLMNHLQKDIISIKQTGELDKTVSGSLTNTKAYKERLMEYVEDELNIKKMITELVLVCRDRMEQVFDKIQENPHSLKGDYVLLKYFETLGNNLEKFDKIVNNAPDQIIQHNITVQQVDQHTAVLQEAVRRALTKLDPEQSLIFIESLSQELQTLRAPELSALTSSPSRLTEVETLKQEIVSFPPEEEEINLVAPNQENL